MIQPAQIQDRSALGEIASAIAVESRWMIADTAVMTWRNLIRYRRSPELFIFSTASPVMFIFLFNYVFGGAIPTGDLNYIDFLMPGILVQTTLFSATQTGVGLAEDLQKGMVDRYRSLPDGPIRRPRRPRHCRNPRQPIRRMPHARRRIHHWNAIPRRLLARLRSTIHGRRIRIRILMGRRTHRSIRPQRRRRRITNVLRRLPLHIPILCLRPRRNHAQLAPTLHQHQPRNLRRRPRPSPLPRRPNHRTNAWPTLLWTAILHPNSRPSGRLALPKGLTLACPFRFAKGARANEAQKDRLKERGKCRKVQRRGGRTVNARARGNPPCPKLTEGGANLTEH